MSYGKEYLKQLMQNEIDCIKSGQIKFLTYPSGSGGEFLSISISKYSNDNYFVPRYLYSKEYNRYRISNGFLYNVFGDRSLYLQIPKSLDFSFLADLMVQGVIEHEVRNFQERVELLDKGYKGLIRSHTHIPDLSTKLNSYYIHPDTPYWKSYTRKNALIKVVLDVLTYKDTFHSLKYNAEWCDRIMNYMDDNDIQSVEYSKISLVTFNNFSIEDAFNMSREELLEYHKKDRMYGHNIQPLENFEPSMILNMSELFEEGKNGRIKELFNITDPEFDLKCQEWHNLNLQLHEKYDV